jgi:hypothetical protein
MHGSCGDHTRAVATDHFSGWVAENYQVLWPHLFDPAVDFLFDLADGGPVVEFGIGTGRLALPNDSPAASPFSHSMSAPRASGSMRSTS